jgi:hypothetical protein
MHWPILEAEGEVDIMVESLHLVAAVVLERVMVDQVLY